MDKKIAKKWLCKTIEIIESVVVLDESIISFLPTYLDHFITFVPNEREIKELDLLVHAPISIPKCCQSKYTLFLESWKSIFPNLPLRGFKIYKSLLYECKVNGNKSLLDIYLQIGSEFTFSYFLSSVSDLLTKGILDLEKLEFVTIR